MTNIYVDGQEGTTGLQIFDRLSRRTDFNILRIDPEKRRDVDERRRLLNAADFVFLCLPDDAAREAVSLIENDNTRIIDASTAHRVSDGWAYGIPELSEVYREAVCTARQVANPGCFATGFNILLHPLVAQGLLTADASVTCHAVSGYSGGGKALIQKVESPDTASDYQSPSFYALGLAHKHLPEMKQHSGLRAAPLFTPIVANYYQGMNVAVPLFADAFTARVTPSIIRNFFAEYYCESGFITVNPVELTDELPNGFLGAQRCNGTNRLEISIFGNDRQILLVATLDNLGKGASGAAVQNMNLMMGMDENTGLL